MIDCTAHSGGSCRVHDHDAPCPECGARRGQPCIITASRYAAFCCGGCYHDHKEN